MLANNCNLLRLKQEIIDHPNQKLDFSYSAMHGGAIHVHRAQVHDPGHPSKALDVHMSKFHEGDVEEDTMMSDLHWQDLSSSSASSASSSRMYSQGRERAVDEESIISSAQTNSEVETECKVREEEGMQQRTPSSVPNVKAEKLETEVGAVKKMIGTMYFDPEGSDHLISNEGIL